MTHDEFKPSSLLAYARDPHAYASPLPSESRRIERKRDTLGGWPAALIAPAIAADLAECGLTYGRRNRGQRPGLHLHGESGLQYVEVTRIATGILRQAAELLRANAGDASEAAGLEYTASDLEISGPAQRNFVEAVRTLLPPPPTADADTFLDNFATRAVLPLTELRDAYDADGRPGGLGKHALNALADARGWPRGKRRGVVVFYPSRAERSDTVPSAIDPRDLDAFAAFHAIDVDALRALINAP
nr:hypothetical protein [Microbacterium lemovicicum]